MNRKTVVAVASALCALPMSALGPMNLNANPTMVAPPQVNVANMLTVAVQTASYKSENSHQGFAYVGTGSWTDDFFAKFRNEYTGLTWNVEIYESEATPGLYLVENPYGDCPIDIVPKGDWADIMVHTEKEGYPWIEMTDLGFTINYAGADQTVAVGSDFGKWVGLLDGDVDLVADLEIAEPGTFADGILTFPKNALLFQLGGTNYTCNSNENFRLAMPTAKDTRFDLSVPTCIDEETFNITATAGRDVASVRFALFAGMYNINDALFAAVAHEGATLPSTEGSWDLQLNDKPNSMRFTFGAVALDASGNTVGTRGAWLLHSTTEADDWTDAGTATVTDDIISSIFTFTYAQDKNASYDVALEQSASRPGLFRLVNPYGDDSYYSFANSHPTGHNHYLVIDATDPERVTIKDSALGFQYYKTAFYVIPTAGFLLDSDNSEAEAAAYYGKLSNGVITFPANAILYGDTSNNTALSYANADGLFSVKLKGTSGITDAGVEPSGGKVSEFFDLQGRKVEQPQTGIYLRKTGAAVEKVVIRQ